MDQPATAIAVERETGIHLRGVRVHNLRDVDVDLPLGRLIVFSGVSGAGKSSLAFDTIYAEAQRRYLQSFSAYTRQFLERLDQPEADEIGSLPPAIAVGRALPRGPRATVGTVTEIVDYLRLLFARLGTIVCLKCGQEVRAQQPADVLAAIADLPAGTRFSVAFPTQPEEDRAAWARALREEGFLRIQVGNAVHRLDEALPPAFGDQQDIWVLVDRLEAGKADPARLTESLETAFSRGHGRLALLMVEGERLFDQRLICARCGIPYTAPEPRLFSFNDPLGACPHCSGTGVDPKDKGSTCPACHGSRLNDQALTVRVAGRTIADLCALSAVDLAAFFADFKPAVGVKEAGNLLLGEIRRRLAHLEELEVGYLSLARGASTLSTGEAQRVRLTAALGSNLVNALYVLDEPTAGLHPRDTGKLLDVLRRLRGAGNTIIVVEHDPDVITASDYVVDLGPGAGEEGGQVVYQGPPAGLVRCAESITGDYLAGRRSIRVPSRRRPLTDGSLRLTGARLHNLQDLTVDFPLGVLCVVTGVSGAGKTTLVQHVLYPALCQRKHKAGTPEMPDAVVQGAGQIGDVVLMDQSPLTRTARSNPATYLKIFDEIRQAFADTSEARIRNLGPGAFSFNQPGGRCETCEGQGTLTVDMQFLADVTVTCPDCHGSRFKPEVLGVKVRSLSIAEVLNLTVREAFRFFRAQRLIERRLKLLLDVGLDYLRLGQPVDTLSGGECQRLKLAGHLAASRKPRCLFLVNEPTTGLHLADIARLLDCFDRLLATGHSLIVVEHNLDVIKCADHVIDLGPGAGAAGGRIVAQGTPEQIARVPESFTGRCLQRVLENND